MLVVVGLLLVAALAGAACGRWKPGSDLGYWLGVAGGIAMLLLLAYPLRKRVRALRVRGDARGFFLLHMAMGVVGPLLIVLHSRLEFGSLNATVAFVCMSLVAASGLVGRFLYGRIHRGMNGERETLAQLRAEAGAGAAAMRDLQALAPEVVAPTGRVRHPRGGGGAGGSRAADPVRTAGLCRRPGAPRRRGRRPARARIGRRNASSGARSASRAASRVAVALIDAHLASVQRVAQLASSSACSPGGTSCTCRSFWLLVACAIAHVVAVHMY